MEAKIYNQSGKEAGSIKLPEEVFGLPWNGDLVHQVVTAMQANARTPVAHTKFRGEISGGGKKPWKQKGTGRARHGSSRSPIWKGGGVTHGPRNEKDYSQKINRKMKAKALYTVLSEKLRKGELLFVDSLEMKEMKTKAASETLSSLSKLTGFERLSTKRKNTAYMTIPAKEKKTEKSFSNLPQVMVDSIKNMNPVDVLRYRYVVIAQPAESVSYLSDKLATKAPLAAKSK
jgi:large subunit ribosomal protein L4